MGTQLEGNLVEIFWSAQGEGSFVGSPTVFVRFGGCDLRCRWCDSPHTWKQGAVCRFESAAGTQRLTTEPNPISLDRILEGIDDLEPQKGSFVSLTGGEPLLQPDLALAIAQANQDKGRRTHLETHGLAVASLETVLPSIDLVAMDWKLSADVKPAVQDSPSPDDFERLHRAFLEKAACGATVCVKVVITPDTQAEDLDPICRTIAEVAPGASLILQPMTGRRVTELQPSSELLMSLLKHCTARVEDVRLIPQTHKLYGAL